MVLCGDSQLVRAHLVGRVTVGDHTVRTHHHSCEGEGKALESLNKPEERGGRTRSGCEASPVMSISLMVRAAMLSVMSVAGIPSATASYAVSLDPWLYGLVSVQYTRFSLPSAWRLRTTPAQERSQLLQHSHVNQSHSQLRPYPVQSRIQLWPESPCCSV